ncbi:TOMM precursor leader peptide-binding protein [Streptomyces drozdowiczii]|nr:TOMM precursor leader peptide-binding protein [Streptomyces drozdowiczii]MCX0244031.1 TOMM precursor leader peptide-binding protein [Streptomyces drozdowiczii]
MAATPYTETAGTRPRVRRDVLFTETPDGVIFHNADGGFRLTAASGYRFATLLVPHLDGSRSVEEICQGFGDRQKAMVGELVKALYARGFARPVPAPDESAAPRTDPAAAERFAQQIAYIDHYADDADARFARYRATRVAVLGDGPVARWCVLSLIRNGCAAIGVDAALLDGSGGTSAEEAAEVRREAAQPAEEDCPVELSVLPQGPGWAAYDGYDVVVAAAGPQVPATVLALLREGVPEGRTLLPAWTFQGRAVVGPVMTPGATSCWACAALRLGAAGGPGDTAAAGLWSGLALGTGTPGAQPVGPLAAMLGNLLGYEVFRLVTGALRAETRDRLLLQDMASFDVASEPLLPHPACPFCAPPAALPEPVDLVSAPTRPAFLPTAATAADDDAAQGPLAALERRSALVHPHAGVFTAYADEKLTQTPLKVGSVVLGGLGARGRRTVTAFDVHHTAGARLRALNTAATLYAEYVVPTPAPGGATAELPAVAPDSLTVASGTGGTGTATRWTAAVSLLTKEVVRVPAGAVRPFGADNADRRFEPTRAGAGAGADLPEAAGAGLLSALAHDALRRAVRGAGAVSVITPQVLGEDPEPVFLLRSAAHLGLTVELLDLGERAFSGASVVLARTTGTPGPALWAVGAATDLATAAVDALRDLLGEAQAAEGQAPTADERARSEGPGALDTGDPLLRDLDAALVPVTSDQPAAPDAPAGEDGTGWARILERLAAAGRDALVVPTHAADLPTAGIHTVRVLLTRAATDAG